MAKISLPERGQPLDVSYLYQMGKAINDLSDQVSTATYNYTTIDTVSSGKQNIKTSEVRMIGGFQQLVNNSSVSTNTPKSFTYTFPSDFKYTPIVTASLVNAGKTSAGASGILIITDITRSSVTGQVTFTKSGNATVNINFIIIGIPN